MSKVLDEKSFDIFKEYLLTMRNASVIPSGREIKMACPFCGDSKSDSHAASFYINIEPQSDSFLSYNCFRASCNERGVINDEFLMRIGFSSYDSAKEIFSFLKSKSIKIGGKYINKEQKKLYNKVSDKTELNDKKLRYINRRLGTDLTYEDLYKLKISLSLDDLLRFNDIKPPISEDKLRMLDLYGICFISAYNDYVIIRDASRNGKIGMRYTNVNVFKNYENVTKTYMIPGHIDLLSTEPVVINIAEGVFDILGVYYNLNIDRKYENQVYIAAAGCGINKQILNFLTEYGITNCKINIFSDSDVDKDVYKELKRLKPYLEKFDVSVYYNEKSKDFGVPKSDIKIIKSKI